jgi:hypothetical protein
MHDAADDATIICALDAPYIRRQVRFDPLPLPITEPKQVSAHDPNPLPKTNQDRIVGAKELMSFYPSMPSLYCTNRFHDQFGHAQASPAHLDADLYNDLRND